MKIELFFIIIIISLKSQNGKKKYKKKNYQNKRNKKILKVDIMKKMFMKNNLQDVEHDDNIDLIRQSL